MVDSMLKVIIAGLAIVGAVTVIRFVDNKILKPETPKEK